MCCEWIYSGHRALCDCTHLTLGSEEIPQQPGIASRGDSTSVYFQSCGTGLCLQTQGPVDSCSGVISLSRSKREGSTEQLCARSRPHPVAGAAPLPSRGHTAPFPPSCAPVPLCWPPRCISPGCRVSPLPADPSLLTPHGPLRFWEQPGAHRFPAWQDPRKGRSRRSLRDFGKVGKVLQRGNL